jgi:adenylate kinase family enzyme
MTRSLVPAIHITGAAGCGVTTLGCAVARALGARHIDADDVYWLATDPPYTEKRERSARIEMLDACFRMSSERGWVLSGSILDWGDSLVPLFTLVVFLSTPVALRLERLAAREAQRHGARIEPGGDSYDRHRWFLDWAAAYDAGTCEGRTRARHEAWLARVPAPILRLDGAMPIEKLVHQVLRQIERAACEEKAHHG